MLAAAARAHRKVWEGRLRHTPSRLPIFHHQHLVGLWPQAVGNGGQLLLSQVLENGHGPQRGLVPLAALNLEVA